MILSCSNIKKSFNENVILENISFKIEKAEKVGIIGVNGAGKSTLFKIIIGEIYADSGEIYMSKDIEIGYFSQNLEIDSNKSIYNELLTVFEDVISQEKQMRELEIEMANAEGEELENISKTYSSLLQRFEDRNGYEYESRIRGVIKGLGFIAGEFDKPVNQLSGGQKTRVALGKLLLKNPDILLLDEPTNHLDLDSVKWLEDYLRAYTGSIMIISHDRYFIDRIVSTIVEIENSKSTVYNGNYSYYSAKKEVDREIQLKAYISQQKEISRQEEVIRKLKAMNREKFIKRAESREKLLSRVEVLEKPENLPDNMRLIFKLKRESGKDVLDVKEVSKSFGDNKVFENISFDIQKGEKIALIGANGIGKTTLLKIIMGILEPDRGSVKTGTNVTIGYYDQEHSNLDESSTVFDEIADAYPKLSILEIRNALAAFVFTGEDVFKPVSALSGGEKGRLSLCKIMLSSANFLILDEPTNHLDINSKEILETALRNYEGTCLYISHDRYFINNTAEKVIEMSRDIVDIYLGNYDYYLEKISEMIKVENGNIVSVEESSGKTDWKKQKEEQANKRKAEATLKRLETEIEECEIKIEELDKKLESEEVYTNAMLSRQIFEEKSELEGKLLTLYEAIEI